ncbi:MAG TPA: hypothetical protein VJM33_07710 [Microthrixaceae bacterium]|nr:hypothetical protein [Microthrixaceae bacterium]
MSDLRKALDTYDRAARDLAHVVKSWWPEMGNDEYRPYAVEHIERALVAFTAANDAVAALDAPLIEYVADDRSTPGL